MLGEVSEVCQEDVVSELIPCPFCGRQNAEVKSDRTGRVFATECPDCFSAGPMALTKESAAAQWNSRTLVAAQSRAPYVVKNVSSEKNS